MALLPERQHQKRMYHCRCNCGKEIRTTAGNLNSGNTQSCGCLKRERTQAMHQANMDKLREQARQRFTTHGLSRHPLYHTWLAMRQRCNNPRSRDYHLYGARGISVCARWDSFEAFLGDLGERPAWATGGLDRIDPDGDYEPANCRWATAYQQVHNRRS